MYVLLSCDTGLRILDVFHLPLTNSKISGMLPDVKVLCLCCVVFFPSAPESQQEEQAAEEGHKEVGLVYPETVDKPGPKVSLVYPSLLCQIIDISL